FEILPAEYEILNLAKTPLPLGVVDKVDADLDTRLNNRFLDLRKEEIFTIFRVRNVVLRKARAFLQDAGFEEVNTPKIVAAGAEGGSTLFTLDYFGKPAYLAQSSQLYKQTLMASGFDRVFEIAPAFRAEESDTVRHIAEFTSLDVEMSFANSSEDVMNVLDAMICQILASLDAEMGDEIREMNPDFKAPEGNLRKITFAEAKEMLAGAGKNLEGDLDTEAEKVLGQIIKEKFDEDIYFITDFPSELKLGTFYARRVDDNPELTGYFDMDYRGQEIVSGGMREHRYDILIKQMEEAGLDPGAFDFYLKTFQYGMPPHGGFGLGIERLVQMILNLSNIRECVLFPRDMHRLEP
ncbi:MAG: aspartate--tRNA(Asn) ligase, partial [Thermoplasmata archaeon]|nr:aspartate--tRNA(Asn) ligase [Thermoplasmata archaeon]